MCELFFEYASVVLVKCQQLPVSKINGPPYFSWWHTFLWSHSISLQIRGLRVEHIFEYAYGQGSLAVSSTYILSHTLATTWLLCLIVCCFGIVAGSILQSSLIITNMVCFIFVRRGSSWWMSKRPRKIAEPDDPINLHLLAIKQNYRRSSAGNCLSPCQEIVE